MINPLLHIYTKPYWFCSSVNSTLFPFPLLSGIAVIYKPLTQALISGDPSLTQLVRETIRNLLRMVIFWKKNYPTSKMV